MIVEGEMINLISNVGFPIAITLYILFRLEGVVKQNTNVVTENNYLIKHLIDKL